MHTTHTSRSQSRSGSHLSHEENTKTMQLEIDHLKRKLCYEQQRRTPSNFDFSSCNEEDGSYRPKSRTFPPMSFSRMMRTTTMNAKIGAHLPKAWEMM